MKSNDLICPNCNADLTLPLSGLAANEPRHCPQCRTAIEPPPSIAATIAFQAPVPKKAAPKAAPPNAEPVKTAPKPGTVKPAPPKKTAPRPVPQSAATVAEVRPRSDEADSAVEDRTAEFNKFLRPAQAKGELGRLLHYRILSVLGEGGMGLVFRAEDSMLRRPVALKVIKPDVLARAGAKDRFLREAQSVARIDHENVIPIHQVGEDQSVLFLAMPLLVGETLEQRLKRKPRLPLADVLRIARQSAEGLAAAHALGLVHRDIKPGNLWLEASRDGSPGFSRVKVLDFGLARIQDADDRLTRSGTVLGTPAFMAPEQAAGEEVDARSDLWSLGVVLYKMLSGTNPFARGDMLSTLSAVAVDEPTPIDELDPKVPRALSDLIARLLAKNADLRPASAAEVAAELGEIEAASISKSKSKSKSASGRWRWPLLAAVAALVIALVGSGLYVAFAAGVFGPPPPQPVEKRAVADGKDPPAKKDAKKGAKKDAKKGAVTVAPGTRVTAEQALTLEGNEVTVVFPVKSLGKTKTGGWFMLNSTLDYKGADNFNIAIKQGADRMKEFGIDEKSMDRVVEVTGIVTTFQDRPQIVVSDPTQIKWGPIPTPTPKAAPAPKSK